MDSVFHAVVSPFTSGYFTDEFEFLRNAKKATRFRLACSSVLKYSLKLYLVSKINKLAIIFLFTTIGVVVIQILYFRWVFCCYFCFAMGDAKTTSIFALFTYTSVNNC